MHKLIGDPRTLAEIVPMVDSRDFGYVVCKLCQSKTYREHDIPLFAKVIS